MAHCHSGALSNRKTSHCWRFSTPQQVTSLLSTIQPYGRYEEATNGYCGNTPRSGGHAAGGGRLNPGGTLAYRWIAYGFAAVSHTCRGRGQYCPRYGGVPGLE